MTTHSPRPPAPAGARTITVGVVNHNTRDQLQACLSSLAAARADRVIVVDNASSDSSVAMVREEFAWVELDC